VLRLVGVLLVLGLAIYTSIDCARTDNARVRGLPKPLWLLVVLLLPVAGPLAWILLGKAPGGGGGGPQRRVVAPDDDPDFLRRLRRPDDS